MRLASLGFALAALILTTRWTIADEIAQLRVLHTSPDAPGVDVWVNGRKAVDNLTFGNSSGYASVPSGAVTIAVAPHGSTTPVLGPVTLKLAPGSLNTVAAIGFAGGRQPGLSALPLTDGAPRAEQSRLRVAHTSPGAPGVDVWLGGKPAIQNLEYGKATDWIDLPPGTYPVEVRVAGTNQVVLGPLDVTLPAGRVTTVCAIGVVGGNPGFRLAAFAEQIYGVDLGQPAATPAKNEHRDNGGSKCGRKEPRRTSLRSLEAPLPKGWPALGELNQVLVKEYPASRAAFRAERAEDGAVSRAFWPLFMHIKANKVSMTAPVLADYADSDQGRMRVAFLYPNPEAGRTGKRMMVRVEDVAPVTVASIALQGPYESVTLDRGLAEIERWLAQNQDWEVAGGPRHLMYENPMGKNPSTLINEVQVPIRPASSKSSCW